MRRGFVAAFVALGGVALYHVSRCVDDLEHAHDVGVPARLQQADLPAHFVVHALGLDLPVVHHLDRDGAPRVLVQRFLHLKRQQQKGGRGFMER